MSTTPPGAPTDEGPRVTRDEIKDLGRLRRSTTDRKVAGVAGGLARHLDIDPVLLRVGFVVLAFFGGAGLILYGALWLLVPEEGADQAPVNLDERSRTIALIAVGVIAALALIGDSWGAYWFPWPLAIIGLIAFLWLSRNGRGSGGTPPPGTPGSATGPDSEPVTLADQVAQPYYTAPPPPAPAYTPPPRDPRKRGPILFWFTLALVAFWLGVLGIADAAGAPVTDSAYPALAVGIIGAMLVLGSVIGRAGGLIAVGLIASLGLAGATAVDRFDDQHLHYKPTSAAAVQDTYEAEFGELIVDLTDVRDLERLDGRTIELNADAAEIRVVVPDELDVEANARIHGPGGFNLFGDQGGGIDQQNSVSHDGGPDAPQLTIDAEVDFGGISVITE